MTVRAASWMRRREQHNGGIRVALRLDHRSIASVLGFAAIVSSLGSGWYLLFSQTLLVRGITSSLIISVENHAATESGFESAFSAGSFGITAT